MSSKIVEKKIECPKCPEIFPNIEALEDHLEHRHGEWFETEDFKDFKTYILESINSPYGGISFQELVKIVTSYEKQTGNKVYFYPDNWENMTGQTITGWLYISKARQICEKIE